MSDQDDEQVITRVVGVARSTVRDIQVEGGVSVQTTSTEHVDVRQSRLRREEESARHRLWMEKSTFKAAAVIIGAVLILCAAVVV